MLKTTEYNSIRGHIVGEIRKETEPIIAQKLKSFLENSESLIKSAKETYAHQLKVLKEENTVKTKLLPHYWELLKNVGMTNAILNQFR